jgi:hypothetical protein
MFYIRNAVQTGRSLVKKGLMLRFVLLARSFMAFWSQPGQTAGSQQKLPSHTALVYPMIAIPSSIDNSGTYLSVK